MPDQFTEVKTTGYGSRIIDSIKGIFFGLILFIASFGVLYWNEGRVDMSTIAKTAIEVSSGQVSADASLAGKLVSTTGIVNSDKTIGDNLFLKPDKFIAIKRDVEMYAWVEKSESHTTSNTGGSSTTTTTYSYAKEWTENPQPSSNFKHPEDHTNPQKSLDSTENKVTAATIGAYGFDPQAISLPSLTRIPLSADKLNLGNENTLIDGQYVFVPRNKGSNYQNPQIGDMRVSYLVLTPGFNGTAFGQLNGSKIDSYTDSQGHNLYRLFAGTREQGIATLHSEYTMWLWILRGIGFLMMWFGLSMLFGPISVILDFLPIFGSISRSLIGGISFLVALVLSIVTILVSMVLHSLTAVLIALAIAIIVMFLGIKAMKKKRAPLEPAPNSTPSAQQ